MSAVTVLLRLVIIGTQTHYESRGLIDDKRLEHLLVAGKQILYKSHQESDTRSALGFDPRVWEGLTEVLTVAIPALEQQSFAWKNPPASSFNGSSSELIAAHYLSLVKDIERLNDLCTIARNLLATTKKAQNLAAEKGFDQQILRLIDVCVRVTARGYDGEQNPRNEERWQKVVNLYKRLLITCLQFLHNFIMHNEQRKLVLWLDLFGQAQAHETDDNVNQEPEIEGESVQGTGTRAERIKSAAEQISQQDQRGSSDAPAYNVDDVHALFDMMSINKEPDEETQAQMKVVMDKIKSDMAKLAGMTVSQLDATPDILLKVGAELRRRIPPREPVVAQSEQNGAASVTNGEATNSQGRQTQLRDLPNVASYGGLAEAGQNLTDEDLTMPRTAQSAAATLQEAKDELMARLHESGPIVDENGDISYDEDGNPEEYDDDLVDSVEDSMEEEEEEDDDEDYRGSGDQERGLLTDVPLVLGPTEIEALPMIIQAGIVDNFGSKNNERNGAKNMQAVRCHILLAQEAGRNVLRELLIFIAAWDLPDDEFYFKMMVQIMEAILKNGLMSHAYSDFGQPKDIISPAQAVVIKILTHIFRAKYSPASVVQNSNEQPQPKSRVPAPLSRVDVLTVRYIFIVFRGNIIPETCALIYLQGQIRAGLALAEDFPLNLWDMERVYEGVYQFLEFFAVLTENNDWKSLLVEWEIVYDLVTLIKELDNSIAKVTLTKTMPPPSSNAATNGTAAKETEPDTNDSGPIAVERPYDASSTVDSVTQQLEEASVEAEAGSLPTTSHSPPPPQVTEEPADFEWRNLKKLIVLVLSSLVWKSPTVQNQIRQYGGLETILSCTQYDACNPYIKEHAVMCLKFLLEGNAENQALVSSLEAREVATPDAATQEVIDKMSLKFQLNKDGKVELNEKEVAYLRNLAAETQRKPPRSSTKDNARAPLDADTANSALVTKTNKGKGKERATSDDEIEFM
ncbi:hypothetical protein H2202_009616 [Exophiala xenobiotica]|nr:hypothetical protein H2202_009616 [Exophiala xenobiotica]KAK5206177.1 hypothetical protein LTR41_008046 [Exophiala xenobiotica]KAK5230337.1 hypothetical protein LTR47_007753 [Exophiala xenobiotica]KAK5247408.1 hypothetical protein LTS06_007394 [Exophiala xenobiotica]KAK5280334.1 hypothetical protein LTR40_006495 [Exophiala xenobiotica]